MRSLEGCAALLFVPGSEPRKLAKALTLGADAVVYDLEDGVAGSSKLEARETVARAVGDYEGSLPLYVRLNDLRHGGGEDLDEIAAARLSGIVLPKVASTEDLSAADERLLGAERRLGIAGGSLAILAIIETALGLEDCGPILRRAPRRLGGVLFGSADLTSDLRLEFDATESQLDTARSRLVVATRAAGLPAPLDGPFLDLGDSDALLASSRRSRASGFAGRVVLHPSQVRPVQRAYCELAAGELAYCQDVVAGFERALEAGTGSIAVAGRFVDEPLYRSALSRLAAHERWLARQR